MKLPESVFLKISRKDNLEIALNKDNKVILKILKVCQEIVGCRKKIIKLGHEPMGYFLSKDRPTC